MSIVLPAALPAFDVLQKECLRVVEPDNPMPTAARPLRIALLNLMPEKVKTETQLARLLAAGDHHVELSLLVPDTYHPRTTPPEHLERFYRRWSQARDEHFDGLIVTGAPVETLDFEAVEYWQELCQIFDWARVHVHRSFYICWAAQAALHHFHDVPKHNLDRKSFGVYKHRVAHRPATLMNGIPNSLWIPVSRHTEVRTVDLARVAGLEVLLHGPETGPCLVADPNQRAHYMFNHLEYDADTLEREYRRDLAAGRSTQVPENYFPDGDPDRTPVNFWRPSAATLFGNWLDEIEREHANAACDELVFQWLAPDDAAASPAPCTELLVAAEGNARSVDRVARTVSSRRCWSRDLTWQSVGKEVILIELRVEVLDQAAVQETVRSLLALAPIRSVAVRTPQGFGGLFRAPRHAKKPGAKRLPNRARLKGMVSFAA